MEQTKQIFYLTSFNYSWNASDRIPFKLPSFFHPQGAYNFFGKGLWIKFSLSARFGNKYEALFPAPLDAQAFINDLGDEAEMNIVKRLYTPQACDAETTDVVFLFVLSFP